MKTLYLVRHAQAVPRQKSLPDPQRSLIKKGEKSAASMAKKMKKRGMNADIWISSTANRAVETAHIYAKVMNRSIHKILLKESVYSAEKPEILAELITGLKNKHKSAMVFGHNPLLSNLVFYYVKDFGQNLAKSGLAVIEFDTDTWKGAAAGTGKLVLFDFPGKDTEMYDQMHKDLRNHIQRELSEILARLDEPAAAKSKKLIKETSKILAKSFLKTIRRQRSKEAGTSRLEHESVESATEETRQDSSLKAAARPEGTSPKKLPEKPVFPVDSISDPKPEAAAAVNKTAKKPAPKPISKSRPAVRKSMQKSSSATPTAAAKPGVGSKSSLSTPERRPGRPRTAGTSKRTKAAAGRKVSSEKVSPKKNSLKKNGLRTSRAVKTAAGRGRAAETKRTDNPLSKDEKN